MSSVSVLIKPASGKCNLSCEYCFYHDEASHRSTADFGRMSEETLDAIVRQVFLSGADTAAFSFQGGEPTLRGLPFFQRFVELVERYNERGIPVTMCLQTNGILLDEEWAEFLGKNRFLVGLSLDGPRAVHDRFRVHPDGAPSYTQVMRAARLLDRRQVDYNILYTVTSASAKEPGKLYSFFKENGFRYLQFMPCIDPLEGKRGRDSYSLLPGEFALFLRKTFDRWAADVLNDDGISIRYFDNLVSIAAGFPPEACSLRGACSCQFVFEADGSCYPCDFYVNEDWLMGNIRDMGLEELFRSEAARRFLLSGSAVPEECRNCGVRALCRGGCRRDRENPQHKNYYCRAYKSFLTYAQPKILQVSAHILRRQMRQAQTPGTKD